MKIILFALNSSYYQTNPAVRCIADCFKGKKHDVKIIERSLKDRRRAVLLDLCCEKADIYGFSCYIWNADELYNYAYQLKALLPESKIVFGGPEVSFVDESFFASHPYIDHVIKGEGEDSFLKLAEENITQKIIGQNKPYEDFIKSGIGYTDSDIKNGDILYYESSRGCPFKCSFCLSGGENTLRTKTADKVIDDLQEFEKFSGKVKIIKFVDRTFNYDIKRANKIWEALAESRFTLTYHFEIRSELLNDGSFEILKRMPCNKIQFEIGIQSVNKETLAAINRKCDQYKMIENAGILKNYGNINIHCDLIAGLPYEDYASFGKSFDSVYNFCDKLQVGILKILGGSQIYSETEKYGIVYDNKPPYTILKNNYIDYAEICKIERIAMLSDRCSSGKFKLVMDYVIKNISSPFMFYEKFDDYIENIDITTVSQNRLCELMYMYIKESAGINNDYLNDYLVLDWLLCETHSPPEILRLNKAYKTDSEKKELYEKYFCDIITEAEFVSSKNNIDSSCKKAKFNLNQAEICLFSFDTENYYLIIRNSGRYYKRQIFK